MIHRLRVAALLLVLLPCGSAAASTCLTQAQAQSAINTKAAANTWLGAAVGALQGSSAFGGWYQQYTVQNGSIWISACGGTGAHIVQGLIHVDYDHVGGPATLGFPTTDEERDAAGNPVGWFQSGSSWFQWGNTAAFSVHGYIHAKWLALAGYQGALGYPTADEQAYSGTQFAGRISSFTNGSIVYQNGGSWQHGTYPVLNTWYSSPHLTFTTSNSSQLGGSVAVSGSGFTPNSALGLWLDNWTGSFQLETLNADANGNVTFPAYNFDNNDAGACTASRCIVTLEVNDGANQFQVVGAYLQ